VRAPRQGGAVDGQRVAVSGDVGRDGARLGQDRGLDAGDVDLRRQRVRVRLVVRPERQVALGVLAVLAPVEGTADLLVVGGVAGDERQVRAVGRPLRLGGQVHLDRGVELVVGRVVVLVVATADGGARAGAGVDRRGGAVGA